MNKLFTTFFVFALMMLMAASKTFAGANDTLTIFASQGNLEVLIGADTIMGGTQKHLAYKLVSTDTTYLFKAPITLKSSVALVGVLNQLTGRPPCIQPDVLADLTVPNFLFYVSGNNTSVLFKNLYLLGMAWNGTINNDGRAITVTADKVRLTIDYVIFDEWRTFAIAYSGDWDQFRIFNCKFRNMVNGASQWYLGEVLRNTTGTAITDTLIMKYNTMFNVNAYSACPVTKVYNSYFEFSHNSIVWSFKNPFFIFNVTNGKVNNNLFYGAWTGGISKTEYPWWDQLWSPEVGSIVDFDALDSAKAAYIAPGSNPRANVIDTAAEKLRKIEVKNNVCFWPTQVTNYWKTWNDSAHVDSVYTPTWMNARTTKMFNDKVTWPGLVQAGNLQVDPSFGTSINSVLNENAGNGVGLLKYFKLIRTNTIGTEVWGYKPTQAGVGYWVPTWPLPEAADMKYANTTLRTGGTDGLPVGDPYWFNGTSAVKEGGVRGANTFSLADAYPNPFNPSTTVSFSLMQTGNVTLKVYNVMGQVVKTVIDNEARTAGEHSVRVNMSNMSSGVYMYTLTQGSSSITKKFVLMK
ncbi:MAG: T9SS type A sorting domain-containing protein [Ignavibacteria bacterium]|nr:T9SS type A sorting domain-containing protein [Ignavibacteria bacterium]